MTLTKAAGLASMLMATSTSALYAGGMAPAIMAPDVIVEETKSSSSSAGILVPLILIALVALAMSKTSTPATVMQGSLGGA